MDLAAWADFLAEPSIFLIITPDNKIIFRDLNLTGA